MYIIMINYPLVMTTIAIEKMAIEIVSFPINSMVILRFSVVMKTFIRRYVLLALTDT